MKDWNFHCAILGVSPAATLQEIKKAYRENASLLHPDKHGNSDLAKNKFQQLSDSYQFLVREIHNRDRHITSDAVDESNGLSHSGGVPLPRMRYSIPKIEVHHVWLMLVVFTCLVTVLKSKQTGYCTLEMRSSPKMAMIFDGDKPVGLTPLIMSAKCGSISRISFKKAGYESVSEQVLVNERLGVFYRVLRPLPGTMVGEKTKDAPRRQVHRHPADVEVR
jgi:hypothetical protein